MIGLVRELCALSILCGAAMFLAPEGGIRRVMSVLCAVVLMSAVLNRVGGIDYDAYAFEMGLARERERSFLQNAGETKERLNRLVIEDEIRTYIRDKAESEGLVIIRADPVLRWSTEGLWIPDAVSIHWSGTESGRAALERQIEADLGIPPERQEWNENG